LHTSIISENHLRKGFYILSTYGIWGVKEAGVGRGLVNSKGRGKQNKTGSGSSKEVMSYEGVT
jgi:hypothetical protein